ncbi:MAG: hypothetical protein Tsb0013_19770 [Phycisphaerales bacterium]
MRTPIILSTVLAAALLTGCASTSSTSSASSKTYDITPIAADNVTMRVNGMSCPKCANNIERQLTSLAGVESVDIDLGSGIVGVGFTKGAAHPSAAQLAQAIDNTGFTLVSIDTGATK